MGRGDGIGIFRRVTTHRVVALAGLHDGGVGDGAVGDAPRDRRLLFLLHLRALVLHLSLQDHLVLHHLPPSERLDLHRQGPLHHLLGEKPVRFVALAFARLGRPRRWIRRHQLHPRACLRVPNGLHSHRLEILHRDRASMGLSIERCYDEARVETSAYRDVEQSRGPMGSDRGAGSPVRSNEAPRRVDAIP